MLHNRCRESILSKYTQGRYIIARGRFDGERTLIASIYAPNKSEPEFFIEFFSQVEKIGYDRTLILGDINTVMDFEIDRTKKIRHPNFKASEIVQAAVAELDLVDVWRTIHPTKAGYTWRQKTPFLAERLCESCQNGRHNEPMPVLPGNELTQSSPKPKTMVVKTINCHHFICLFYQACAISA